MTPDQVRDVATEAVVEHLTTTAIVQALAAVEFAYAGCDEVRINAKRKAGETSINVEMYRDGVQLGEFGT